MQEVLFCKFGWGNSQHKLIASFTRTIGNICLSKCALFMGLVRQLKNMIQFLCARQISKMVAFISSYKTSHATNDELFSKEIGRLQCSKGSIVSDGEVNVHGTCVENFVEKIEDTKRRS